MEGAKSSPLKGREGRENLFSLRFSSSFSSSPSRNYTLHRVRDYFREKMALSDPVEIEEAYHYGLSSLEIIKRQVREGGRVPRL